MSFKKEDHPGYYGSRIKRKINVTHNIHSWEEWCEICEEHDEDPFFCFDITLDKGGGNYECFEYKGDIPSWAKE